MGTIAYVLLLLVVFQYMLWLKVKMNELSKILENTTTQSMSER